MPTSHTDGPWLDDASSLVDAFRSGERSPAEELEACLGAIEASELNAFCYVATEEARERVKNADPSLPFGGVPVGIKELDPVPGWPHTEASLAFKDRVATYSKTWFDRLVAAGAVPVGQCTASEFGGLNVSVTKMHGVTGNGWDPTRTAGGSSGGSSSAVAGGLVPIASGGDGGGSIRIPAAFSGLLGMKGTAGRIPRGPFCEIAPLTVVLGCQSRSVRDVARWYDVCAGHDSRDPYSLAKVEGWERDLGSHDLAGKKAVIAPDLGSAVVRPDVAEMIVAAGEALAKDLGLELIDVPVKLPGLGVEWAMANLSQLLRELKDLYPECEPDLTMEIAFGMKLASEHYNLEMAARVEEQRIEANETMAAVFDEADFIIAATNPDVAYPAEIGLNLRVGTQPVGPENNGALTIPANIVGNPAVSIPVGTLPPIGEDATPSGTPLPVGMQIIGRHLEDALLLDLALAVERERPWPKVAPGAPR
ncbi:MAG: amidase [Actinobacteria bacterium]|nr:amidase [Actinomycetota bacterium]